MELRQLRQFNAVAETLSFRQAAEQLHMAQPPLSVAIRKLESELGVLLFERDTRSVRLTAAGSAVLEATRRCLNDVERIAAAAQAAVLGESGRLRIGFVGSATYRLMPMLLPRFRRRYPNVQLVLRESTNSQILEEVEREALDVGLVRFPTIQPSPLRLDVVERDVFCAALPAGHVLARKRQVTLRDLAAGPFIDYSSAAVPGLHALVMLAFEQSAIAPQVAQEATQVQTVLSLVAGGLGLALVPSISARHAPKEVVFRKVRDLPPSAGIGLATACRSTEEAPVVARFREMALATGGNGKPG